MQLEGALKVQQLWETCIMGNFVLRMMYLWLEDALL